MKVDQGSNSSIDQFFAYAYDANDRLLTESLDTGMDSIIDQITTYGWGVSSLGTQETSKTVHDQATNLDTSRVTYGYDLQGRMETATTETFTGGLVSRRETLTHDYDSTGIRVSALDEIDANADGTFETRTFTQYLIDPQNFTGYQQVLTETAKIANTGEIQKVIDYTIGQNLIAQTTADFVNGLPQAQVTLTFCYDGHGSTRLLTDLSGAIAIIASIRQIFAYDAYGNALGFNPALVGTSYLYSGEQFSPSLDLVYLRARYYSPTTGRFSRLDPHFGLISVPPTLNKYAYAANDPVTFTDPSGLLGGFAPTVGGVLISIALPVAIITVVYLTGFNSMGGGHPGSLAEVAARLDVKVVTRREEQEQGEVGYYYFLHGSTTGAWRGRRIEVQDSRFKDFGNGFYTFPDYCFNDNGQGRVWAANWAIRQANREGGIAFVLQVKILEEAFWALVPWDLRSARIPDHPMRIAWQTLVDTAHATGYDDMGHGVIMGPLASGTQPGAAPILAGPDQFAFMQGSTLFLTPTAVFTVGWLNPDEPVANPEGQW
jgi:RHS repeat-associated protein